MVHKLVKTLRILITVCLHKEFIAIGQFACLWSIVALLWFSPSISQNRIAKPFFSDITDEVGLKAAPFTWPDGTKYKGEFKDNKFSGYGELFLKSGATYKGDFLNGLFHGVGTYTFKNGQTYQGEWKNDKREGMGKITWPSGASSYGPFKNDKRHGTHDYTYDSGEKEKILYDIICAVFTLSFPVFTQLDQYLVVLSLGVFHY